MGFFDLNFKNGFVTEFLQMVPPRGESGLERIDKKKDEAGHLSLGLASI